MNGPIICTKGKKFDFKKVLKRASTWAAALVTSAGAVLTWYIAQPPQIQETIPTWLISGASMVTLLGVILVPLATSYSQQNLKE